jgi:hypothetical protein
MSQTNEAVQKWDERYAEAEYAYGEKPNHFFQEQITQLQPGKILLPLEGEGRNAVYAATKGWQVNAFDQSIQGKKKALALAAKYNSAIQYKVGDFSEMKFTDNSFDATALIFAHLPEPVRKAFHRRLVYWLKPGGTLIIEGYSVKHLEYNSKNTEAGGPKEAALLYTLESIKNEFLGIHFSLLEDVVIDLNEGQYHNGTSAVIRAVGIKK